jgi:hypothetical protein
LEEDEFSVRCIKAEELHGRKKETRVFFVSYEIKLKK